MANYHDLVITNGLVVLPQGPRLVDVLIKNEKISGIVAAGTGSAKNFYDASDRIVIPGGVDPHVHLMVALMGQRSVYDFETGGIAALRGGTTTIVDFALQRRGGSMLAGLQHRLKQAAGSATTDYGFHLIATDVNYKTLAELKELNANGVPSIKVYTVYEEDGLKLDDGSLLELMKEAVKYDMMIVLHAENAAIIERLKSEAKIAGHLHPRWHAITRPPIAEIEAINRAILFSKETGCALHILHLAAADALENILIARRKGIKITAETCTHYLALTEDALEREDGHNFIISPPLRTLSNQIRLWEALSEGTINNVASDEVSYSAKAKALGLPSFANVANGCTGIEARLPVLYTLGVVQNKITLERFVELFSTWPAEIFGMGDRKGKLAVGYDADITIIDPKTYKVMTPKSDYGDIGYNNYSGMNLTGWCITTILRGNIVVHNNNFCGKKGQGKYIARSKSKRPVLI